MEKEFDLLEWLINHLREMKYGLVDRNGFELYTDEPFPRVYSLGIPYPETIYGTPSKFNALYSPNLGRVCFETIWQKSSGSVDSKFPYLVHNIKEKYPWPTFIVLDGGGYRKGAETWLRAQVDNKLIAVMSMKELEVWSKTNL